VHNRISNAVAAFKWLDDLPYLDQDGQYVGRTTGEAIALAVGLSIRDICAMHFSRIDPDGEDDVSIPKFVANSRIEFAVLEEILIPFCSKMRMCIGHDHFAGDSASRLNTPIHHATEKVKRSGAVAANRKKTNQIADRDSADYSREQLVNERQGQMAANPAVRGGTAKGNEVGNEGSEEEDQLRTKKVPHAAKTPTDKRKRSGALAASRNTKQVADDDSTDTAGEKTVKKQQLNIAAKPAVRKQAAKSNHTNGEMEKGVGAGGAQPPPSKAIRATAKKSKSVKVLPTLQGDEHLAAEATTQPTATRSRVRKAAPEARSQPLRRAKQEHTQIPPERKVKRVAVHKKPA
jgi:hypothetical protein